MGGRDVTTRPEARIAGFPSLPIFDRLAPPPDAEQVRVEIESWTKPGEVVVDLNGRGGWIARSAVALQRRAADYETSPLTRLLAEVALKPPDVRHLDAAVQAIGAASLGGSSVRSTIDALFATRCPSCGRTIAVESLIWEAVGGTTRAIRREYRCQPCHDQLGGPDLRHAEPEQGDLELALSVEPRGPVWDALRRRFPVPRPDHALPDQLLGLHTPRQLLGLHAILDRIDGELRAAPVTAALRLALLGALVPSSRLNSYPGRHATLRIAAGALKPPSGSQWRERNPWLAFEESYRSIRGFVQRLEAGEHSALARFGPDLLALEEGTANVAIGEVTPSNLRRLVVQAERVAVSGRPSRVRLALGQPPLRWTPERLATAYHGTAWVLGAEAASLLPLDELFATARSRSERDAEIVALARSLAVVAPVLAPTGHAVVMLDSVAPEALVGTVLSGEAAGYRLAELRLHPRPALPRRTDGDGVAESRADTAGTASIALVPPGGVLAPGPRTRANRPLAPVPGGSGDPRTVPGRGLFSPPERLDEGPYRPAVVRQVVTETAVEVLKARGEPATFEQLLPDLLLGLDRSGQLARLARRWSVAIVDPLGDPPPEPLSSAAMLAIDASSGPAAEAGAGGSHADGRSGGGESKDGDPDAGAVAALLELIRDEMQAPTNRRLCQVDAGQYWLGSDDDRAEASSPIADRVEWAAFGLLSAARQLSETSYFERMASLFPGRDAPDEALVRACLDSYREPASSPDSIVCLEQLEARSREHDQLIVELAELGHRLGMRVWIGRRQQGRRAHARPLGTWLDDDEVRPHLPLIARGAEEELERIDCAWYVPHKASFLFEVEWTAMLSETVLVRHARIPTDDNLVRFLVVPPERAALIRFKLARSPLLRDALTQGNWHLLKWNQLREFAALESPSLDGLEPFLGLDPLAEKSAEQLALFEA